MSSATLSVEYAITLCPCAAKPHHGNAQFEKFHQFHESHTTQELHIQAFPSHPSALLFPVHIGICVNLVSTYHFVATISGLSDAVVCSLIRIFPLTSSFWIGSIVPIHTFPLPSTTILVDPSTDRLILLPAISLFWSAPISTEPFELFAVI